MHLFFWISVHYEHRKELVRTLDRRNDEITTVLGHSPFQEIPWSPRKREQLCNIISQGSVILRADSLVAQQSRIHLQCRRHRFVPTVGKIPWQPTPVFSPGRIGKIPWQPTPVFSPGRIRKIPWQPTPVFSHLENSMDRGAWWATVHGVVNIRTQLSN